MENVFAHPFVGFSPGAPGEGKFKLAILRGPAGSSGAYSPHALRIFPKAPVILCRLFT